ncbi:MAG TPA: acyl-CoA dehydrogenase family protein [Dehalococcoidia bacterium]|nr:acyl-CoA dehydrogenase family protein [Dehalococcoidia bacterium]
MTSTGAATDLIAAARALAPRLRVLADETERERRLPAELIDTFRAAGFWRMWTPAEFGGSFVDPFTFIEVIDELARADGSAAWNVLIGAGNAIVAGWLPPETQREIWGDNPDTITGGVYGPRGTAVAVPGGYRVDGRWAFGSGVQQCAWMVGGCFIYDGDQRRLTPAGQPAARIMVVPIAQVQIIDTWRVAGMRGSGSHDYAFHDLFVPEARSFDFAEPPLRTEPLYRLPRFGLLASALSAACTGIARHAIEALQELAQAKTPTGQTSLLRERAAVQADVARAEALLRSARAFRTEALGDAWRAANAGVELAAERRALVLLAAANAATASAQAVDLMYNAGGASSIYETSPLERCFRDVHVATQHYMLGPLSLELAGKALLGFDMSGSGL